MFGYYGTSPLVQGTARCKKNSKKRRSDRGVCLGQGGPLGKGGGRTIPLIEKKIVEPQFVSKMEKGQQEELISKQT